MTYKIKKMVNNGTEYKIGSIDSSNDTYADIVHLTQAQYDALENPDPDTLYSTPDNAESGEFKPENEGTPGQVVTKTTTGYKWNDGIAYYTEAEYESLPDTKLTDGINYGIYDGDGTDNTLISLIKNGVSYCIPQGGIKYAYVDILLVGGGANGGRARSSYENGGGGGAGGVCEVFSFPINNECNCYPVTIGGAGGNTCFSTLIGYGGASGGGGGGSLNGCYCGFAGGESAGGDPNPTAAQAGQGTKGGKGIGIEHSSHCMGYLLSGGGGGAGTAGCDYTCPNKGGNGGDGYCSCMSGTLQWYAGGGGGGVGCYTSWGCVIPDIETASGGQGGCGGGGEGGLGGAGCPATYYGGGGGGSGLPNGASNWNLNGGAGCQGIVILRYKKDGSCGLKPSRGGYRYECGDYYIHCFTNTCTVEQFMPIFK